MAYFELCNCGTVNVLQWSFCAMSILVFVMLHYKNAPYGRYSLSTSSTVTVNVGGTDSNHSGIVTVGGNESGNSWAWIWQRGSINANTAWFLQELPSFIIPVLLAVGQIQNRTSQLTNTANAVLLCMFCVHYFHRTFLFPLTIKEGTRTPLPIFLMSFIFCSLNGYLQACSLISCSSYPDNWTSQPTFFLGASLFFAGMAVNVHSDRILSNLRQPGGMHYQIPTGGMFTYVSGANYFGEIVEWCGFALACWSMSSAAMALFTASNLVPRAVSHHRWYLMKFAEDYPKNRKALVPFLY